MAIRTYIHPEVADLCNFKCEFCPPDKRSNKMFDIDEFRRVLDVAKDTPIHGVWCNWAQLNGNGEPLLYPHLIEAIRIAKERFPFCDFISNGSLINEEKARELIASGIDEINISITGVIPEVYCHFQGSGIPYEKCVTQLQTVIENVKGLARLRDEMHGKTYIRLRYIRSEDSAAHLKDFVKFWKGTGVDEVYVTSLWSFKRSKKRNNGKLKVLRCSRAPRRYQVSANGEVFPCVCNYDDERNIMGNIHETPFEEIITSEKFLREKQNRMSCDLDIVPKSCLSCENRVLRPLGEELRHMRAVYYLKSPMKTLVGRLFGPAVVVFERITRYEIFYNMFLSHMRRTNKKIHDEFIAKKNGEN